MFILGEKHKAALTHFSNPECGTELAGPCTFSLRLSLFKIIYTRWQKSFLPSGRGGAEKPSLHCKSAWKCLNTLNLCRNEIKLDLKYSFKDYEWICMFYTCKREFYSKKHDGHDCLYWSTELCFCKVPSLLTKCWLYLVWMTSLSFHQELGWIIHIRHRASAQEHAGQATAFTWICLNQSKKTIIRRAFSLFAAESYVFCL